MTSPIVFVVSEDAVVCNSVKALVETAGLQAKTFPTLQALLEAEEPESRGCLVFYAQIGNLSDQEQQARLAAVCARRPGILITERGDVPMAVRALKAGVMDVVQKPYRDKNLLDHIEKALETHSTAHR